MKCEICEEKSSDYECFNCETEICEECNYYCEKFDYNFCCEECRGCWTCDERDNCKQYLNILIDSINEKIRICISWTKSQRWKTIRKNLTELRDKIKGE